MVFLQLNNSVGEYLNRPIRCLILTYELCAWHDYSEIVMKNYFQELNAQENDKLTQSNYTTLLKHKRFISFLNILDAFLWSVKLVKY